MRLIVELPEGLARQIRELEFRGRYDSAEQFIWTAVENQLLLESRGALAALTASDELGGRLLSRPASAPPTVAAEEGNAHPLWGMVNRFLPVVIGARALANMLAEEGAEWVLLEDFERKAGGIAREFGLFLQDLDAKVGRKGEQRLSVGLPIGSRPDRSLARYQDHFLAATPESALRKMGLAATTANLVGEQVVGITKAGVEFAALPCPSVDEGDYTSSLSEQETAFLRQQVRDSVPGEWALWTQILELLGESGLSQDALRTALGSKRGWEAGTLTTMLTVVLARMKELGLVRSRGRGPSALYEAAILPPTE